MGKLLHFAYNYFELEGIPPYTSQFVPIDFQYEWWVDQGTPQRFRFEKRFTSRLPPMDSGLVILSTSTGPDARIMQTDVWDGQPVLIEKDHPHPQQDYEAWIESFTTMGRKLVATIEQPSAKFQHVGLQSDEVWGPVHVFQRSEVVQSSDVYAGLPLLVTHKIHADDYRWIEMEHRIPVPNEAISFRSMRLLEWSEMDGAEVPSGMFEQAQ